MITPTQAREVADAAVTEITKDFTMTKVEKEAIKRAVERALSDVTWT